MGISKFNHKKNEEWGIDTKDFPYKKASELEQNKEFHLHGVFITPDSGYGKGAVAISEGFLVNLPQRFVETVQDILDDEETVMQIKSGICYFKVLSFYSKKFKRTGYDIYFGEYEVPFENKE